jgi:hypothetical protein
MKNLKLIMLFSIGALFIASKSFGQANPFINVLPSNSGIVSVGGTIDIEVTIGNTGPISLVPQAKLRPIIQVPPSVTFLPNAQQTGLPAGWTILTNTGSQLRLCNSSDAIPVSTSRTIILKAQGVTITPAQTFSGNINFGNGTTCAAGTSVFGDITTDNSALSTIQVVAPISATVNTKLFLQGYWNGTNMVAARYDNLIAAGSTTPGNATDVDEVTIELRNATTYALAYSATGILQTNGNLTVTFPSGSVGNNYYVVVKHQSGLQLWSASPVTIASTTAYDFSDNIAKAYTDGSNPPMALLASGVYGLYTGDVNGDEFIDITDFSLFEIDVDNSTILGLYSLPSDFNGDTFVDLTDYPVFDFNNSLSLYAQHP